MKNKQTLGGRELRYMLHFDLSAKFSKQNINIYLHFMYFLQNDMTRVVEILPQVRQGPLNIVNIMAADGQGNQQPYY